MLSLTSNDVTSALAKLCSNQTDKRGQQTSSFVELIMCVMDFISSSKRAKSESPVWCCFKTKQKQNGHIISLIHHNNKKTPNKPNQYSLKIGTLVKLGPGWKFVCIVYCKFRPTIMIIAQNYSQMTFHFFPITFVICTPLQFKEQIQSLCFKRH